VKWFRSAAAQGSDDAQFFLAVLLQKGIGAPRDTEAASAWFRRAAEHGHRLAMLELAQAFELGLGIPADPAAAKQWRERAKAAQAEASRDSSGKLRSNQRVDPGRPRP
jgi:localization factor PodJL